MWDWEDGHGGETEIEKSGLARDRLNKIRRGSRGGAETWTDGEWSWNPRGGIGQMILRRNFHTHCKVTPVTFLGTEFHEILVEFSRFS